uniref:F-box associated beta-propeller type 1 domain-containing protein n=1 Tax=Brassica oleracea TaxID=3712 RepID=A0A3P6EXS2_BRAOL|nr:unnamed protein product [Brassica oleracea]
MYWFAKEKSSGDCLEVFRRLFLSLFDFTRETFGPSLPLMFEFHEMQDTLSLSSVIEEQLSVLFQPWDTLWMEIWITTKIEPNGVFQFALGSFFIDAEKKVAVVFDKNNKFTLTTSTTRNTALEWMDP